MAASTYFAQVQQLYIAYFGRPADTIGLNFWANAIDAANGSIAAVQAGFSASAESQALFGNKSTIDKVTAIYQNAFGRAPEPAGLAFWVARLDSGAVTQAQASWTIQQSAGAGDAAVVQNKLTAAQAFTAQIDTTAEIQGYQGTAAADAGRAFLAGVNTTASTTAAVANAATALSNAVAVGGASGSSFVLTTGSDNIVGDSAANTINGYVNTTAANTTSTLTAADSVNGGAGIDTLSLVVEGTAAGSLPAAVITNVEKFLIRDVAGAASTYNFANVDGETAVTSNVSTNAVTFANVGTGTVVGLQGNNSATLGNVSFSQATATDAVNVALIGGLKGATNVTATAGTATAATVTSSGAANTVGTLTLTGGTSTLTSLTLNATTDLTATLVGSDSAANAVLTITGAGKVNLGTAAGFDGSSIDASGNTGGVTVGAVGTLTSFKGGAGNDVLAGANALATNAVIDGGAGIDSVAATLINSGNAAIFKNFEQIELAGAAANGSLDATLLSGSTISGVTINGALGGAFALSNLVETTAGFNVGINASATAATTLGFTAASVAGTTDVLNVAFNGTTGAIAGNTLTAQGIETINISSKGAAAVTGNSITVADNVLKSLVITGDKALNVTVAQTTGNAATALTSVDASAATAGVTISTSGTGGTGALSALTIKGSTGADTIGVVTSANVGSVGATVTTGAGNDTVNVSGAAYTTSNSITTVTDFAKGDSLAFGGTNTFTAAKVDVTAQSSLTGALTAAVTTANATTWFNFGGDTYVVANDNNTAFGATDTVVKLAGVLDLSTSTITAGTLAFA